MGNAYCNLCGRRDHIQAGIYEGCILCGHAGCVWFYQYTIWINDDGICGDTVYCLSPGRMDYRPCTCKISDSCFIDFNGPVRILACNVPVVYQCSHYTGHHGYYHNPALLGSDDKGDPYDWNGRRTGKDVRIAGGRTWTGSNHHLIRGFMDVHHLRRGEDGTPRDHDILCHITMCAWGSVLFPD